MPMENVRVHELQQETDFNLLFTLGIAKIPLPYYLLIWLVCNYNARTYNLCNKSFFVNKLYGLCHLRIKSGLFRDTMTDRRWKHAVRL